MLSDFCNFLAKIFLFKLALSYPSPTPPPFSVISESVLIHIVIFSHVSSHYLNLLLKKTFSICIGWLLDNFLANEINPFPNKPWFLRVCSTSLLKTLREKEKLLVTSNFSFSHSVFYPFRKLSAIFFKSKIVVCKLFQFGRV